MGRSAQPALLALLSTEPAARLAGSNSFTFSPGLQHSYPARPAAAAMPVVGFDVGGVLSTKLGPKCDGNQARLVRPSGCIGQRGVEIIMRARISAGRANARMGEPPRFWQAAVFNVGPGARSTRFDVPGLG